MPNIIQAEFFHVDVEGVPLVEVLAECRERIMDSFELAQTGDKIDPHIKTVVRFFDRDEALTHIIKEAEKIRENIQEVRNDIARLPGPRRLVMDMRLRWHVRKSLIFNKLLRQHVVNNLRLVMQASGNVSVETSDHSFRFVRSEERHDMLESVARSKTMWVFVFGYGDLLFDSNDNLIAYLM
jgi:hypothetical protein